jgi:regulator-associated protein of mTOR
MVAATTNVDPNEDARSTSSTLVNGENSARNDVDVSERPAQQTTTTTTAANQVRHGFDQELYEEDIIRFLYYSEKRHDTNAKPNPNVAVNVGTDNNKNDWVNSVNSLFSFFFFYIIFYGRGFLCVKIGIG